MCINIFSDGGLQPIIYVNYAQFIEPKYVRDRNLVGIIERQNILV